MEIRNHCRVSIFLNIMMNLKKLKYGLVLTVILFLTVSNFASGKRTKIPGHCNSFILIQGSSNLNQFEFINYNPVIHSFKTENHKSDPYQKIQIPVFEFAGSNDRMLEDFFKMINARQFPFIKINIEARELADINEASGLTSFRTKIFIAGKSNDYEIPCEIDFCNDSGFILRGNLKMKLTDFNIEPPKKVLGAVAVDDEVFITFAFKFEGKEE